MAENWRKSKKEIRGREIKKMKIARKTKNKADFEEYFQRRSILFGNTLTEFKRKFAVQSHFYPRGFCGGLQMSVARRNSIRVLGSNSSNNPPSCSIFQARRKLCHQSFVFISDEPSSLTYHS